ALVVGVAHDDAVSDGESSLAEYPTCLRSRVIGTHRGACTDNLRVAHVGDHSVGNLMVLVGLDQAVGLICTLRPFDQTRERCLHQRVWRVDERGLVELAGAISDSCGEILLSDREDCILTRRALRSSGTASPCITLVALGSILASRPTSTGAALGSLSTLRAGGSALTDRTRLTLRSGLAVSACWASFTLQTLDALRATGALRPLFSWRTSRPFRATLALRTSGTFSSVGTISTSRTPRALLTYEGVEPFGFRADKPGAD